MITYVDTSSLMKLVVDEQGSAHVERLWESADTVASSALVVVEGRGALAAARRGKRISAAQHRSARSALEVLVGDLVIVEVTQAVVAGAADMAEEEALRGDDAVHLVSALVVGADVMSSVDSDLCAAAERRGLHVANPLDP